MAVETTTDVEELTAVQDSEGNRTAPATETQQQEIVAALSNGAEIQADRVEPADATAEQLPDVAVPDGSTVLFQGHHDNSGPIYIGNEESQPVALLPDQSAAVPVANLSTLWVRAPSDGDAVGYLFVGET